MKLNGPYVDLARLMTFPDAEGSLGGFDPFVVGLSAINTSNGVNTANGARLVRWPAPRTTNLVGFVVRVVTASGNIEASVYDEEYNKLGGTGQIACPSANNARFLTFATPVPVKKGKSYWFTLAADNTTAQFGTITPTMHAGFPISGTATNMYPSPAVLNPLPQSMGIMGASPVFILIPLMEPALTRRVAPDLTVAASALVGADPQNNRIFGRSGSATLVYSTNNGATMTAGPVFTGQNIQSVAVAGNYLFVATFNASTQLGSIWRGPRNGPFTTANFTEVLPATMEGYARPWSLKAYEDGIIFAGNYIAPYAGQVRLRRSTDWGATWQVVIDLGAGNTSAEHVHSVVRSTLHPNRVYCNVGDGLSQAGLYVSDDSGATWTRKSAFGPIRLTPGEAIDGTDDVLWGSDQYGVGGNLWYYNATKDTLQPRAQHQEPWYGDVYAMCRDTYGRVWYFNRGEGVNASRRACLFMTPDLGYTNYYVAELGVGPDISDTMFCVGNYIFLGNGKRFNIAGV